jgi:two-component system, OmpR family, copper resistance phosphate regulon response regulator CusR
MRILLVEDELNTANLLAKGLREDAYAVDVAEDGEKALAQAYMTDYDLVILDVMLPRKDGFDVCRELRSTGATMPILMLTARDAIADRIRGLDTGADDYLVKPFNFEELLARMRALLRRKEALYPDVINIADLAIHTRPRQVSRAGAQIELSPKEYALLEYLARRANEVVGRAELAEHVWDENFDPFSKVIEVSIQRLRRKVDDKYPQKLIHTRRGEGYILTDRGLDANV